MPPNFQIRLASPADLPRLTELMDLAISELQRPFLSPAEIAASRAVMGLDSQLIADRTYFVVEDGGAILGCGGWSRRATLYGGDHSAALRAPRLLDAGTEAARVRAMYTHPQHARRGVGRAILAEAEAAARGEGFRRAELMATLAGAPLYRASGYQDIERIEEVVDGAVVPLIRMDKGLS